MMSYMVLILTPFVSFSIGILSCLDGYMNIALEQTEEHVNGNVTNRYGDAFIRGNNGMSFDISPSSVSRQTSHSLRPESLLLHI